MKLIEVGLQSIKVIIRGLFTEWHHIPMKFSSHGVSIYQSPRTCSVKLYWELNKCNTFPKLMDNRDCKIDQCNSDYHFFHYWADLKENQHYYIMCKHALHPQLWPTVLWLRSNKLVPLTLFLEVAPASLGEENDENLSRGNGFMPSCARILLTDAAKGRSISSQFTQHPIKADFLIPELMISWHT